LDEQELFQGLINRPVRVPSREFILAQADKCKKFIDVFRKLSEDIPNRVKEIVLRFRNEGASARVIQAYDNLNDAIYDAIIAVAKRAIRKKWLQEICRIVQGRIGC
jgi:hypothetical protein